MVKVFKTRDVKTPTRGTSVAAGIDFFIPNKSNDFCEALINKGGVIIADKIMIPPHNRINIPSGIKVEIPDGYALIAFNKSGVSLNYGLDVGATVVDQDYAGEVHLSLVNTSNNNVYLDFGQKIIQFVLIPMNYCGVQEVASEEDLFTRESERGAGAFGSTGTM